MQIIQGGFCFRIQQEYKYTGIKIKGKKMSKYFLVQLDQNLSSLLFSELYPRPQDCPYLQSGLSSPQ